MAHPGSPGKRAVKRLCVCVCINMPEEDIQSNVSVHHYSSVTLCFVNICQKGQFWAASIFWQLHAKWGQVAANISNPGGVWPPWGLLQLSGGCANKIWLVSANPFIQATCPNRESWRDSTTDESGGSRVIWLKNTWTTQNQWQLAKLDKPGWFIGSLGFNGTFNTIQVIICLKSYSFCTLLVGCQEEHPACKKSSDEVLPRLSVWSEMQTICIWPRWCHCHPIISCLIKIQISLTFPCDGQPRLSWKGGH